MVQKPMEAMMPMMMRLYRVLTAIRNKKKAYGNLDETNGNEVDELGDEVKLVAVCEFDRINVLYVAASSKMHFGHYDELSCDTLWRR